MDQYNLILNKLYLRNIVFLIKTIIYFSVFKYKCIYNEFFKSNYIYYFIYLLN